MDALKVLTSPTNDSFKKLKKLLSAHGLKKSEQYLLPGQKILKEVLTSHRDSLVAALYPEESQYENWRVPGFLLAGDLFRQLDVTGGGGPLFLMKKKPRPIWQSSSSLDELTVFCPLGDPKNVGALLRSCLAFGVKHVVLLKESASPYLQEALRAAAGSHLHLELLEGPSLEELQGTFVTLDASSPALLADFNWPEKPRLLIGEEGRGLARASGDLQAVPVRIPTSPQLESLNASVAAALALYDHAQKRLKKGL